MGDRRGHAVAVPSAPVSGSRGAGFGSASGRRRGRDGRSSLSSLRAHKSARGGTREPRRFFIGAGGHAVLPGLRHGGAGSSTGPEQGHRGGLFDSVVSGSGLGVATGGSAILEEGEEVFDKVVVRKEWWRSSDGKIRAVLLSNGITVSGKIPCATPMFTLRVHCKYVHTDRVRGRCYRVHKVEQFPREVSVVSELLMDAANTGRVPVDELLRSCASLSSTGGASREGQLQEDAAVYAKQRTSVHAVRLLGTRVVGGMTPAQVDAYDEFASCPRRRVRLVLWGAFASVVPYVGTACTACPEARSWDVYDRAVIPLAPHRWEDLVTQLRDSLWRADRDSGDCVKLVSGDGKVLSDLGLVRHVRAGLYTTPMLHSLYSNMVCAFRGLCGGPVRQLDAPVLEGLHEEQREALKVLEESCAVLTGSAGCGKTHVLCLVPRMFPGDTLVLAFTGKATSVLQSRMSGAKGVRCMTMQSWLYRVWSQLSRFVIMSVGAPGMSVGEALGQMPLGGVSGLQAAGRQMLKRMATMSSEVFWEFFHMCPSVTKADCTPRKANLTMSRVGCLLSVNTVVLDEYSMIATRLLAMVVVSLEEFTDVRRILLCGDAAQISPVGAGDVPGLMRALGAPHYELKHNHRVDRDSVLLAEATRALRNRDVSGFLRSSGPCRWVRAADPVGYVCGLSFDVHNTVVLVIRRAAVDAVNRAVMRRLHGVSGYFGLKSGVRFVFKKNVHNPVFGSAPVCNGQVCRVETVHRAARVALGTKRGEELLAHSAWEEVEWCELGDSRHYYKLEYTDVGTGQSRVVLTQDVPLSYMRHAYAATVWSYQGSQARDVIVCVTPGVTRKLLYTAATRAMRSCVFVASDESSIRAAANLDTPPVRCSARELALAMS